MIRSMLIYGDSLVYGLVPGEHRRYSKDERWTGLLNRFLTHEWEVIEEGLRSRTLEGENPFYPNRDGSAQFGPILASHLPLDFVVIALGTNDCMPALNKSARQIAESFRLYHELTKEWSQACHFETPRLIFMSPPALDRDILDAEVKGRYNGAYKKSLTLPAEIKKIADELAVLFFDASQIQPISKDGVHLGIESNTRLAEDFSSFVSNIK